MEIALAHDIHGAADDRLIVLLHGLSSGRASYAKIVPTLVDAGWRVCNADLRGHGESARADRYRASDYADDVAALIRSLDAPSAVVVGHSLGGLTATALAMAHPDLVDAVFLEDPPLYEGDDAIRAASPAASFFPVFVAQVRRWRAAEAPVEEVAKAVGRALSPIAGTVLDRVGPRAVESRARAILAFDPATMDAAIDGETWVGFDPSAGLDPPTFVLRADPAVGAVFTPEHETWFKAAVPHAVVDCATGQAHGIHEDPDGRGLYLEALLRFLGGLGPTR